MNDSGKKVTMIYGSIVLLKYIFFEVNVKQKGSSRRATRSEIEKNKKNFGRGTIIVLVLFLKLNNK
jgi:hypothetical protein